MIESAKNDYSQLFLGYPLSSEHYMKLFRFLSKPTDDTFEKYVDWEIYHTAKRLLEKSGYDNDDLLAVMKEASQDEKITKKFNFPKQQRENVANFQRPEKDDFRWGRNYRIGRRILIEKVLNEVSTRLYSLDVNNEEDVMRAFSNLDASCGAVSPGDRKKEKLELITRVAKYMLAHPEKPGLPALTFKRSQISNFIVNGKLDSSNIKYKYRLVWCVDAATVLVEALYARPLMDVVLPRVINYAGGKDDDTIGEILVSWWKQSNNWLCLDYSSYDSTVPSWLIQDMFDIIKMYFKRDQWKTINWIAKQFINMRLILPDGEVAHKDHGIPSGSYFTQLIGTLCNLQVVLTSLVAVYGEAEALRKLEASSGNLMFMAMGDDNVIFVRGELDDKALVSYIKKVFGLEINLAKCDKGSSGDYPAFLKRRWTERGAWRDPKELFVQMMHPEFWRSYENYSPYHIIYGYYLTYPLAFEKRIDIEDVIIGMAKHGGIERLNDIRKTDLPGSLRYLAISNPRRWREMVKAASDTAKVLLKKQA